MRKNSKFLLALAGFSLNNISANTPRDDESASIASVCAFYDKGSLVGANNGPANNGYVDPDLVSTYSSGSTMSKACQPKGSKEAEVIKEHLREYVKDCEASSIPLMVMELLGPAAFWLEKLDEKLYSSLKGIVTKNVTLALAGKKAFFDKLRFDSKTPADVKSKVESDCRRAVEYAYDKALEMVKGSAEYHALLPKIQKWNSCSVHVDYSISLDGPSTVLVFKYFVDDLVDGGKHVVDVKVLLDKEVLDGLVRHDGFDSAVNDITKDEIMLFLPAIRDSKFFADLLTDHKHMIVDRLNLKINKAKLEEELRNVGIEFKFKPFRAENDRERGMEYSKEFVGLLQNPLAVNAIVKSSSVSYASRLLGSYMTDQPFDKGDKVSLPRVINEKIKDAMLNEGLLYKLRGEISQISSLPLEKGVVASGRIDFSENTGRPVAKNIGLNPKIQKIFDLESSVFVEKFNLIDLKEELRLAELTYENGKKNNSGSSADLALLKAQKKRAKDAVENQKKLLDALEKEKKGLVGGLSDPEKALLKFHKKGCMHPVSFMKLTARLAAAETKVANYEVMNKIEKKKPNASADEKRQAFEVKRSSPSDAVSKIRRREGGAMYVRNASRIEVDSQGGLSAHSDNGNLEVALGSREPVPSGLGSREPVPSRSGEKRREKEKDSCCDCFVC